MKKIKDKKILVLVAILAVFTIGYFTVVNKISYAFENDYDLKGAYNKTIETITKCAEAYGLANLDNFNEEGLMYITVQNLIDQGYVATNGEGHVVNSLNYNEPLNDKKIRLKYEDEKVLAEIYS